MNSNASNPIYACDGKDRLTATRAREVASRMNGSAAYHCPHCKAWHIGHRQEHRAALRHKRPRFYDNDPGEDA